MDEKLKLGNLIKKPEEIMFQDIECKIIMYDHLFRGELVANSLGIEEERGYPRIITLEDIGKYMEINKFSCCTVIIETPLNGKIYRYNNYNQKEWMLVGEMYGYA